MSATLTQGLVALSAQAGPSRFALEALGRLGPQLAQCARRAIPFLTRKRYILVARDAEILTQPSLAEALDAPSYVAALAAEPGGSRAAIGIDGSAVAFLLEGTLGGASGPVPPLSAQTLTGAQRALIGQVVVDLMAALSPTFERGAGLRLNLLPESFGARPNSASMVALALEIVSESDVEGPPYGRLVLAVSKHALMGARAGRAPEADREAESRVARVLDDVEVELVAELGRVPTTLRRLASLRVGEILRTDARTDRPVDMRIEDRVVFRGHPTTAGTQLAVRVLERAADSGASEGERG